MRSRALPLFKGKLALMQTIETENTDFIEAKRAMELETQRGLRAFLQLQYLFGKNYRKLFQTPGGSLAKLLRALLYPIMQLYMYH